MFKKNATMAELVKTTQAKEELESQLKSARERITELEKKLQDTDLEDLKEKAKKSAAEFEGLKDLYTGKIREFDSSREIREEEFARESAVKRHDLEEEIRTGREANQEQVSNTVRVFAGSYLYYMDQIRMMMDALSQAAAETGSTLFSGEPGDIKERFGASIAGRLRKDVGELEQGTGDRLLIGAVEESEGKEVPDDGSRTEQLPETAAKEEPLVFDEPV